MSSTSSSSKTRSSVSKRKKKQYANNNRLAEILQENSSDLDWHQALEKDVKYMTMLHIAREITREKLGSRTSKFHYLAHCAYLALVKIINLYFFAQDPGEEDLDKNPSWMSSPEIPRAERDTLVGWSVPVLKDVVPVLTEPRLVLSHSSLLPRPSRLPVSLDDVPPFSVKPPVEPEEEHVSSVEEEEPESPKTRLSETSLFTKDMAHTTISEILKGPLFDKCAAIQKHKTLHRKLSQQGRAVMRQIEVKLKYLDPSSYPAPRVPVTYVVTPVDIEKEEKQGKHTPRK